MRYLAAMGRPPAQLARHANVAFLVLLVLALAGLNLFWTAHQVNVNNTERARQGAVIERALCADVGTMAQIQPPSGPAATNPSRAYEQAEHRAWAGLVRDLGCKETR